MIGSPKLRYSFLLIIPVIFLTSCATLKPKEIPININLITLDKDLNPIDAVCNLGIFVDISITGVNLEDTGTHWQSFRDGSEVPKIGKKE